MNNAAIGVKIQSEKNLFDVWALDGSLCLYHFLMACPKLYFSTTTSSVAYSSVHFKQLREANVKIITQNIDVRKCRDQGFISFSSPKFLVLQYYDTLTVILFCMGGSKAQQCGVQTIQSEHKSATLSIKPGG